MSKSKDQYVDISFSSRERVAIRQALEDEIEKLKKMRFYWTDEDKRRNRIIICKKAMAKVLNTLHRQDFKDFEEAKETEKCI